MVPRVLIVLALALPLAFAACGGDDDENGEAPPPAAEEPMEETTTEEEGAAEDGGAEDGAAEDGAGGGGETVQVSETDFALDPPNPTVRAGRVTFEITNDGQAPHNLEIEGGGTEAELEEDLGPGESGRLRVELEPGTYEYYCPVGNHADLGMEGTLTVE